MLNRGIPIEQQEEWLTSGWEYINHWNAFGGTWMTRAAEKIQTAIENQMDVLVIIDSDLDGYTSASILMNYLYAIEPEWSEKHLSYLHHCGKEHGLSDVFDEIMDRWPRIVIVPDGGTNDVKYMKALNDIDINVLVLDHHLASEEPLDNGCSLVVNVQTTNYPNKSLTGAGVAWQFCRAMDELFPREIGPQANQFLDLCALGNCADMADSRELEIRALMNLGFDNIKNPFFFHMCKQHEYTLNKRNGLNYLSIAFAVVPFVNAITRSGTMEEKDMVFKGMLTQYAFDKVSSSKRGQKDIKVYRYQEAVTIADRVKRRQDKLVQETVELLDKKVREENLLDKHEILFFACEPDEVESTIAGLIANKMQAKYQRPCIVARRVRDLDGKEYYRGSGRNYSYCPIEDMRQLCESTELVEWAQGHSKAFGISIAAENIDNFLTSSDMLYVSVDFTPVYWVDYIWKPQDLDAKNILEIADLNIWGQEMPQSSIVVQDIPLSEDNVQILGLAKGRPTLKIECNGIEFMKFGSSEEEYEHFIQPNSYLTIIGTCSKNEWNGNIKPQIMIDDFELEQRCELEQRWVF